VSATAGDIGWFDLGGVQLRLEPARDDCFRVVRTDTDMEDYPDLSLIARREILHRHMTNEITSIDIAAQMLVDFPDAPWELRMELARQTWDETRHVAVLYRRLKELGGYKGEFPISAFEWCVTSALDSIVGRLTTQNRTLEAGAMDIVGSLHRAVRAIGDDETADVLEGILADEVQHVRFANRWIKKLVAEQPRLLMKVATAVRFLAEANSKIVAKEGEQGVAGKVYASLEERVPSVNVEDRKLAEFTDEEVHEILRQAGFRTLIPQESPAAIPQKSPAS
jgi:uncharacterized ferritin-like protein (DUF455 family)